MTSVGRKGIGTEEQKKKCKLIRGHTGYTRGNKDKQPAGGISYMNRPLKWNVA